MKVILIHGQNHKGSTYHLAHILLEHINSDEVREFFLPKDLNHFCLGCYQCIEDETKCPFFEEKKVIMDAMERADLFIFTTPNYCLGASAPMKSLLDLFFDCWMVHRPKDWMFHKKAVVLSTSAGASTTQAIKTIKNSLFYWGVPYIKSYGIPVAAMNWDMVSSKKKNKISKELIKLAKQINHKGTPRPGLKTKGIFHIMAGMHKAGWDASPVEKEYWIEKGWFNNERPWDKRH